MNTQSRIESEAEGEGEHAAEERETSLDKDDTLQIGYFVREVIDEKKVRTLMEEEKSKEVNHGDLELHREELERSFEKKVLMAAREVQSENAVWVVGFDLLEPVFFLVMGKEFPEPVGPPPWFNFNDTLNGFKSE